MASPFAGEVETATLTFSVTSSGFTIDEETGVEIPDSTAVVVQVFLQQDEDSSQTEIPGVNATDVFMVGYCVDPMILPAGIGAGAVADYEFIPAYGATVRGKFRLHRMPPSPFAEVQLEVGDEIEGYLNIGSA